MLRFYAVEPDVFALNLQTTLQIAMLFGHAKGRLIVVPDLNYWKSIYAKITANERNEEFRPVECKKIKEKAKNIIQNSSVKPYSSISYKHTRNWVENIKEQHLADPFDGVLSIQESEFPDWLLVPEELDDESAVLKVEIDDTVPRDERSMIEKISPLFRTGKELLIIDRYFDPAAHRFKVVFDQVMKRVASKHKNINNVKYHLIQDGKNLNDNFIDACKANLIDKIPPSIYVEFYLWKEHENLGEQFHARYYATEKCGVRIDAGTDKGKPGQTTAINLISTENHTKLLKNYHKNSSTFDLQGIITVDLEGKIICNI